MDICSLLRHPALVTALHQNQPRSKFSGQPLTLSYDGDIHFAEWTNCLEPDWWHDPSGNCHFNRQDIRPVTDDELIRAADAAGIDQAEVFAAFLDRIRRSAGLQEQRTTENTARLRLEAAEQRRLHLIQRDALAVAKPHLNDPAAAAAALAKLENLLQQAPRANKLTRKGKLLNPEGETVGQFTDFPGMYAWLYQHGHRVSVDDRHHFLAAAL